MKASVRRAVTLFCALASGAPPSLAQTDDDVREASRSYQRALEFVEENRIEEATREFERAFALSPHYAVLYNLAKAYAILGRPIDALDALRKYTELGGERIDVTRRLEVDALKQRLEGMIARLQLSIQPVGAQVFLGPKNLGAAPFKKPVFVAPGDYVLTIRREGYAPAERRIHLEAGALRTITATLLTAESTPGFLVVSSPVPDVTILVDRTFRATTAHAVRIPVDPGVRTVECIRQGYRDQRKQVVIESGKTLGVSCPLVALPEYRNARLALDVTEPGFVARLDGDPAAAGQAFPSGRHTLSVVRDGFVPFQTTVVLPERVTTRVAVTLMPTPEYRRAYEGRVASMRTMSYVSIVSGVALVGTAAGLALWNKDRYADYQKKDSELSRIHDEGPPFPPGASSAQRENDALLDSIQGVDTATIVLSIVGSGAILTGIGLLTFGPNPARYRTAPAPPGALGSGFRGVF